MSTTGRAAALTAGSVATGLGAPTRCVFWGYEATWADAIWYANDKVWQLRGNSLTRNVRRAVIRKDGPGWEWTVEWEPA